jgi:hypothetical protein
MRIVGRWLTCDDDVIRPTVRAVVQDREGRPHPDDFLIDSGSDRTVLSADLLRQLGAPAGRPSPSDALLGIGGGAGFVLLDTQIEFVTDDGRSALVRGEFAAFTDSQALELSILGRDVLDNFDLIISRRRDEVLLLAPNHPYHVSPA